MKKTYKDYCELYDSDPCKLLRSILEKAEGEFYENKSSGVYNRIYNKIITYFNKERLHTKYTEKEFHETAIIFRCAHKNTETIKVEFDGAVLVQCKKCGHKFYPIEKEK